MKVLPLLLTLVALISGCASPSVRTSNAKGLNEQELATVSTHEEEGLFGASLLFKSVDGEIVTGVFDRGVNTVKVTPGKHVYEVIFRDLSFALFESSQSRKITFHFDAIAGHEYIVHFVVDKSVAQKIFGGGGLEGWVEDKTTGEKLPLTGGSSQAAKKKSNQKHVLEAPAADLAQGYLAARASLAGVERLAKSGAFDGSGPSFTLKSRGERIDKDNVDEYLAKYQKQLSFYREAIKQRGYANIAGAYKGEATRSCANSNSLLAAAIQQKVETGVEIRQEGFDAQIAISLKQNDEEMSIENRAAIAETAIAVIEATNSDYYFVGEIKDKVIVFKPDVSVLDTWPKWAHPPSRSDLENCTVTLAAIAGTDEITQEVLLHSYEDARAALRAGDYTTAVSLLEPLAKKGDADAQNALGILYARGLGVERDYDEALRWYQKAVSQGHVKAQVNLGELYVDGKGVEQDHAKAASLFLLSAKEGNARAQLRLGLLYDKGLGVQRDYSIAAKWYRKAAEQGDATAQGLLGAMYAKGEGVEKDYSLAMMWYRKSAEQGHPVSQYNLGHMFEHGEGVVADKVEAEKWYRMAAEKGHAGAEARLDVLKSSK